MELQQLTYEVDDGIATITLNRPDKLNAFTSRMVHEMVTALDAVDADDDVRAVIVTGAGRGFCAGADMSEGAATFTKTSRPWPRDSDDSASGERSSRRNHVDSQGSSTGSVERNTNSSPSGNQGSSTGSVERNTNSSPSGNQGSSTGSVERNTNSSPSGNQGSSTGSVDNKRARDGGGIVSLRLFNCLKPVIGAVNGPAVGVGSTMLLPMDIRISSTEAKFGFVFTQRGIVPEATSSWFLPRVVGISQALEWSFSGKVFSAEEALAGGLVKSLHAPDDLMADARALAKSLTENTSSVSVAMARQQLWRMLGESHPMAAHQVESAAVPQLGAMADAQEGVTSFLEKRPPNFTLGPANDMPDVFPWFEEPEFRSLEEPEF